MEKPFTLQIVGPEHPLATAAQALVGAVFLEKFGNTEEVMHEEYDRYAAATRYIVMTHRPAGVVGALGVIEDNPAGFKSVNDLSGPPWNVPQDELAAHNPAFTAAYEGRKTLDAATLAVDPRYRGRTNPAGPRVSLGLLHGLCALSRRERVECWVTILEDNVLNEVMMPLGRPLTRYQDPRLDTREYLGAVSTPMYSDVVEYQRRLRRDHPDMHAIFFEGHQIRDYTDIATG